MKNCLESLILSVRYYIFYTYYINVLSKYIVFISYEYILYIRIWSIYYIQLKIRRKNQKTKTTWDINNYLAIIHFTISNVFCCLKNPLELLNKLI